MVSTIDVLMFEGISLRAKIALPIAAAIMLIFFAVQTCVVFGWCDHSYEIARFGYMCVVAFMPPFVIVIAEIVKAKRSAVALHSYHQKLNHTLVDQSHNDLFYLGKTQEGAKELTKQITESIDADRCSIWLYGPNKESIVLEQLYIRAEDSFYQEIELFKKDFTPYFDALDHDPIIIAHDAEKHTATSCFRDSYLRPLGIKSMLDVPIIYKGEIIGVVCIENLTLRKWREVEVEFAQLVASLYAFAFSVKETVAATDEIHKKNTYLEHAAKILRHDMHSGINTYIPRGVTSLERRLNPEIVAEYKLEAPLRMIKEGLAHAQKVYRGVYEFTNLVKKDAQLETQQHDLREILIDYLSNTSYMSQVAIDYLPIVEVNQPLFCTAIDNFIRNGLKYNDSEFKMVAVFMNNDDTICIQDNGRGMTQEEFLELSKPYTRREGQKESGTGLGLNISIAILKEHGFEVSCERNDSGTMMKIRIK